MGDKNILVVDLGLGNLGSVISAITRLGFNYEKLKYPPNDNIKNIYSHLILPGVGSFYSGMLALENNGFKDWIPEFWVKNKKPLLGICLGMQLLASNGNEGAEEAQLIKGLDLIPGEIRKIPDHKNTLLPHIGWNEVCLENSKDKIFNNIPNRGDFYFVHSYAFNARNQENILAKTTYGESFCSVIKKNLCFGVQFHPEKSQKLGSLLLKNFFDL